MSSVNSPNDGMQALFWKTGKQRELYTRFHNVLIHDNTYATNKFDAPLSVFTGFNQFGLNQLLAQVGLPPPPYPSPATLIKLICACGRADGGHLCMMYAPPRGVDSQCDVKPLG